MSSTTIWIVVGLVVGILLLGISSAILRSLREEAPVTAAPGSWTQLVDESLRDADPQLRLDIVERLGIVDTAWSRGILQRAKREEQDVGVRSAIELALER